jgi:hypothetical protein
MTIATASIAEISSQRDLSDEQRTFISSAGAHHNNTDQVKLLMMDFNKKFHAQLSLNTMKGLTKRLGKKR